MTRVTELTPLLKRLQLGPMAATLPERIALARRDQLDYASFLEIILSGEVNRRADRRMELRVRAAGFEETCRSEDFDWTAAITLSLMRLYRWRSIPAWAGQPEVRIPPQNLSVVYPRVGGAIPILQIFLSRLYFALYYCSVILYQIDTTSIRHLFGCFP